MKTVKQKWDNILCWVQHDWVMVGHIKTACETDDGVTYLYDRGCAREGCGRMQTISICAIKGMEKIHFLEKEWTEKK